VPDTLKELVTTTYACETNSGLKAEQEFELNDLDEGGVTDFYEFLNSEVPLLNQNGYFQLNLYSAPLYRVLFNNIWGIETGITIQSAGLDPQNPDDDRADFDDDLITNADEIKNQTNIFIATGNDISFATRNVTSIDSALVAFATADFNNAGQIDFAVTNRGDRWSGNTITVFLADNNNFVPSPSIVVGSNPASILAAMFVPLFVE